MRALAHLCLGTASWNQEAPYNDRVPPDDAELRRILDVAEAGVVRFIDTAVAYGNAEDRLATLKAWTRFKIITKIQASDPAFQSQLGGHVTAVLSHRRQDEFGGWGPEGTIADQAGEYLVGESVYTVAQATAALDAGVQVLQVPWSGWSQESPVAWGRIRDRAYADGVLFFGRQPFGPHGEGLLVDKSFQRDALAFALSTNPRGWCVVGVETAAQLTELIAWREALCL